MPLVASILSSLYLLRVVLVRLKLNVLLLLEELLLLVDDFHLALQHFMQPIVIVLVLDSLDELHQDVLAPFGLHFVVCHLFDG